MYDIYGVLSNDLHGKPWSGPSIKVYSGHLDEDVFKYISCLAEHIGFQVDQVV